ncbi:MAG: helix-turn-helix domain-containing protein [Patescibacteria group bacterium]|nr:helix-turn-helix domain-containing protein [Patescibacteria group bacterium]
MKIKSGKFWMPDDFIDRIAKTLTPYEQTVYMVLCRHANSKGETFVGARRISDELNINKNTVSKSIKHLIAYGLVIQLSGGKGKLTTLKIPNVPFQDTQLSRPVIHKEDVKEENKEALFIKRERTPEEQEHMEQTLLNMRDSLVNKFNIKKI